MVDRGQGLNRSIMYGLLPAGMAKVMVSGEVPVSALALMIAWERAGPAVSRRVYEEGAGGLNGRGEDGRGIVRSGRGRVTRCVFDRGTARSNVTDMGDTAGSVTEAVPKNSLAGLWVTLLAKKLTEGSRGAGERKVDRREIGNGAHGEICWRRRRGRNVRRVEHDGRAVSIDQVLSNRVTQSGIDEARVARIVGDRVGRAAVVPPMVLPVVAVSVALMTPAPLPRFVPTRLVPMRLPATTFAVAVVPRSTRRPMN